MEYRRKGCDFSSGFAKLTAELHNTKELKQSYNQDVNDALVGQDVSSIFFEVAGIEIWENQINDALPIDSPAYNQKRVDYFCQRTVLFPSKPVLKRKPRLIQECRTFYERKSYKSRVVFTVDHVYDIGKTILNIKFSDDFQCVNCTELWINKGYRTRDRYKRPEQQFFKEFDK